MDFLYLNEQDMLSCGVKNMHKCMETMEEVFKLLSKGDYRMGGTNANEHGCKVTFPQKTDVEGLPTDRPDYRFTAMPAYLGGRFRSFGIKSYGSNLENEAKGLPRSILMMQLLDSETGVPLAYMSANILSAMRTAAAAGVGAKCLCTEKEVETVTIIGPGTMGRYTMSAFFDAHPNIKKVKIKGRGGKSINRFIEFCKENFPTIENYIICESIEEACYDSDIIYYGTTNAARFEDNPSIKHEWIKPGALVISASALLVDTDFLAASDVKLIADNYKMYDGWGNGKPLPTQKSVSSLLGMGFYDAVQENKITRDSITDIGDIYRGKACGRETQDQIILYAVGGMPVEDVAWAFDCYQVAIKNNIGTKLTIWDKSAL